ncbi:6960_t:CDS:2 [Ambispora leptoticha]|uniref:6960_t:CDS:1 n=1 Tax=Ambispora leptoticha TaxID=144679 RepID=A0A9N8V0Y3_9GLOM|nr:6960_t:CDS:2 [Ambispora leptoticha]
MATGQRMENMNKKSITQTKIEELNLERVQVEKAARERIKKDGEKEFWWLEHEVREKTEFDIYYQALELFKEMILKKLEDKENNLQKQKAQEQSLKLGQFYTPECLVELCLELLQPKGELFDPCCGLGSFLLKAKAKDESLKISGNDIATDLGELPFEFTSSDYLKSEDKEHDYIIANIPFNIKKSHFSYEQIKESNFILVPSRYEKSTESNLSPEEIDKKLVRCAYELRYSLHLLIADAYNKLLNLDKFEEMENQERDAPLANLLGERERIEYLQKKIQDLMLEKYFKDSKEECKTPPTKNPEYYENGTLPWLNGGALTNLYFLTEETKPSKMITEKARLEYPLLLAQSNSVVFSNVNTDKESSNELTTATLFFALRQLNFSFCSNGSVFMEVQAPLFMNMKIN